MTTAPPDKERAACTPERETSGESRATTEQSSITPGMVQGRVSNARARLTSASSTDLHRLANATGVMFHEGEAPTLRRVSSALGVERAAAASIVIAACGIWGRDWRAAP